MLFYLIVLFTAIPLIELALLIKVGQHIGTMNTVMIVLVTGMIGAIMARLEGLKVLFRMQTELNYGRMPADSLFDGVLILVGGILLITPGLMTDCFGFLMLFPLTRSYIKEMIRKKLRRTFDEGKVIDIRLYDRS
ncbi:MAG: FxsA family protein [Candidatus Omnitrophica bacterium]|nr:FxsA family protein [Candidatus Omnitrophota bacterium]